MTPPEAPWVTVAVLGKTRGNRGELTAYSFSGKPDRFANLCEVYLFPPAGAATRMEIEESWYHERTLVLKFRGIDSISDAEAWSGAEVRVPWSQRTALDEGEFFESDLIGCEVVDRGSGQTLGRVAAYQDGGGAGLLELADGLLIPFARAICVEIDVAARRIAVNLPEGLREVNRP